MSFFGRREDRLYEEYLNGMLELSDRIAGRKSPAAQRIELLARENSLGFFEVYLPEAPVRIIFTGYLREREEQHVHLQNFYQAVARDLPQTGFFAKYGTGWYKSSNGQILVGEKHDQLRPELPDGFSPAVLDELKKRGRIVEFDSKETIQYRRKDAWDVLRAAFQSDASPPKNLQEALKALIEEDDNYSFDRVQLFLDADKKRIAIQAIEFCNISLGFMQKKARENRIPYVVLVKQMAETKVYK